MVWLLYIQNALWRSFKPLMLMVAQNSFEDLLHNQAPGTHIAVGTEINMVARLDAQHEDLNIQCLEPTVCPCSTMYMIHPVYLMDVLERLESGEIPNQVIVEPEVQEGAKIALERMLSIKQ